MKASPYSHLHLSTRLVYFIILLRVLIVISVSPFKLNVQKRCLICLVFHFYLFFSFLRHIYIYISFVIVRPTQTRLCRRRRCHHTTPSCPPTKSTRRGEALPLLKGLTRFKGEVTHKEVTLSKEEAAAILHREAAAK